MRNYFSLSSFKNLFVFGSNSITVMCLFVYLFVFILLGICWASLICKLMFLVKFGKFFTIISSLSEAAIPFMLVHLMLAHQSLRLCLLFFGIFFPVTVWVISIDFSSVCWFFLLPSKICYLATLVNFHWSDCFSTPKFPFLKKELLKFFFKNNTINKELLSFS